MIRLSGPHTVDALTALCGSPPPPREGRLRVVRSADGEALDQALAFVFPAPHSFTGEDCGELHLHGSPAVMRAVTRALAARPGLRPAEPGEFARRAFANGRMDLTEAEGLADLIDSETEAQRRLALRLADGALRRACHRWSDRLDGARAQIEAAIDFGDEGDVDDMAATARATANAIGVAKEIASAVAAGQAAERLRDGYVVALLGRPNAGKSSLLNALARRDVAIVSSLPGTTRDVIETMLDIDGWPVRIVDLAGLRDATDEVEAEGVRRARARAETADLRLAVIDGAAAPDQDVESLIDSADLKVWTKADRTDFKTVQADGLAVSAKTGAGLDALSAALSERAAATLGGGGESVAFGHERERAAAQDCLEALSALNASVAPELTAEALRSARAALGRITGQIDVEGVLDLVFGRFCIGK